MINDLPPEKSSTRRPLQIKTAVLLKVLFSQYFQHQNIKQPHHYLLFITAQRRDLEI